MIGAPDEELQGCTWLREQDNHGQSKQEFSARIHSVHG
jgi:hypothetical protein